MKQRDTNTDATLALLSNEEVDVCVQAIIQDTDCMEYEAETDTNHLSTHADQGQRSKVTGTPESTSDLALMESYGQCFDDWLSILPTLPPEPVPGGNGEQCPASKSLPDASGGGKHCGSSPKLCHSIQSLPGLNTDTKEVCVSSKSLPGSSATTHHYSTPKSLPSHSMKCESTPTSLPGPSTKCESAPTSLPGPNADTKEVCVSSKSLPGSSATTHHYSTPKSLPDPSTKSESTPTSLPDPNTRHTCSPRPLSCHQPPQNIETSVREQDKTGRQRNGSPPHLGQDIVSGEKLHSPDLFRTQFPDEEVQRSCVTQHRWRGRALQSSTESSGSFSSKRNAANPTRVRKKVRGVIDETQDLVVDKEKEGNDEGLVKQGSSRGLELVREIIQETEDMVIDEGEDGITNGEKQGNEEIVKRESCYGEGDMREVIEETEELITYDGRKRMIKESMKRENWFSVEDRREIIEETEDMIIEEEEKELVPKLEKRGKQTQVKNIKSFQKLTKEPKHFNTHHLTSLEHRHQDTSPSKNTHRGREAGENCNTSQSNKREMRIRAGLEEPQCGRTNTTNTTTFAKTKAAPKRNSHSRKNSAGKILAFLDKNAVKESEIKLENTTGITTRTSTPKRNQEHTPDIHTDTHTDTDKSTLSLTSSIPSAQLVEGPQGTEVEAWTVPVDERHGVLLTTSLATTPTSCVLLVVQECGLGLWGPSAGAEGWVLLGKTQHSIRDIANLR
ncbi:uncharacterized protein LOC123514666 [Portunus trituberculatus]|uniref:uncharacterized protein LOC123514666 n=1 Tax=Portunus trituberculatus TaxID=210409 RepID=UPI001E1CF853|nr:uncharacterized protein LOC123514666 [Portunus trituberculatus]